MPFRTIKKIAKKAVSAAAGFAAGGPVGAIATLLPKPKPVQQMTAQVQAFAPFQSPALQPFQQLPIIGRLFGPGKGRIAPENGQCPKGYHLNKNRSADGQPARSFCTRNRRTNFANGRAAARSGRRLRGTVKLLKKSFTLVAARPPKGKFIVKKRGR